MYEDFNEYGAEERRWAFCVSVRRAWDAFTQLWRLMDFLVIRFEWIQMYEDGSEERMGLLCKCKAALGMHLLNYSTAISGSILTLGKWNQRYCDLKQYQTFLESWISDA